MKIIECPNKLCINKTDKFTLSDSEDELQIYVYGRTEDNETVIRIKEGRTVLFTGKKHELEPVIEDIQEKINFYLESSNSMIPVMMCGTLIKEYDIRRPDQLINILSKYSPHLYSKETPYNWFLIDEEVLQKETYFYCPHCGRRYQCQNGTIVLAPTLTTFTYCRKCGIPISKVYKWQDAVCEDKRCIEQSNRELRK